MTAVELIRAAATEPCQPWPRHMLSQSDWMGLIAALAADPAAVFLALWADTTQVHALFQDAAEPLLVSVAVEAGTYAALSPVRPLAAWFERMVHDLWGHRAIDGIDARPWLDHGRWPHTQPMAPRPGPPVGTPEPPNFTTLEASVAEAAIEDATAGTATMQLPCGPLHGLIEPAAHLRLALDANRVRRAEARLGYTHKGTLMLMRGKSPRAAARFVARLSGEATVAHAVAFARAAEAATETPAPPRATLLRTAAAALETAVRHLDLLARLADAAGLAALHLACAEPVERLHRAAGSAFGHRLMMDVVVPGGLAADLSADGGTVLTRAVEDVMATLPALHRRLDALYARLDAVGRIASEPSPAFGTAATPGRAAAPTTSDAAGRARARWTAATACLDTTRVRLAELPEGPISVPLPAVSGEGIGCAESADGTIWHWLRLDHGQVAAAFPRDPGWALWPLAEIAMTGASTEEVSIIRQSFGLSASGLDL